MFPFFIDGPLGYVFIFYVFCHVFKHYLQFPCPSSYPVKYISSTLQK